MVYAFKSTFQATHNKRDLGFKGPKSTALEEHFANFDSYDHTWDVDGIGLYFAPSSPTQSYYSIPWDFFDDPLSNIIIFINMVSFHEIDPFDYLYDDDPLIAIEFMDSSTSSLGVYPSHNIYSSPHSPLGEVPYSNHVSSIFDLSRNDHSYLPILK